MRKEKSQKEITKMSTQDRISLASERADEMWQYIVRLIRTHKNNEILLYTDTLSSQIPPSHAAHAYNDFQRTMWLGELVKLTAMWDDLDLDKCSIPTIVALTDNSAVCRTLYRSRAKDAGALGNRIKWSDIANPNIARHRLFLQELARIRAACEKEWQVGIEDAKLVAKSKELKAVRDYRNSEFAHNLRTISYTGVSTPISMKYGYEKQILEKTIKIANGLNGVIRDAHFDYEMSVQGAEKSAKELWLSCKFTL